MQWQRGLKRSHVSHMGFVQERHFEGLQNRTMYQLIIHFKLKSIINQPSHIQLHTVNESCEPVTHKWISTDTSRFN